MDSSPTERWVLKIELKRCLDKNVLALLINNSLRNAKQKENTFTLKPITRNSTGAFDALISLETESGNYFMILFGSFGDWHLIFSQFFPF